ncbi:MAG: LacI family DNA-binding transcriptional regulator [Opitutaceae bacterium]|jgi:LacI family fructose operon transcriptional repressor
MPHLPRFVTLQDIADHTGYGRSTVSMALRGHPGIPGATCLVIKQAAEKLGYRPNPFVASLMTRMRGRKSSGGQRIALISRFDHAVGSRSTVYYRVLYEAILEEARRYSLGVDQFYNNTSTPLSGPRLSRILKTRGIHGVILFPGKSAESAEFPELVWDDFTTVLIGHRTRHEEFHKVVPDNVYHIDCALQHAQAAGCRRIGLMVPAPTNDSTNEIWSSRFLNYQHGIAARDRVPLLFSESYRIDEPTFSTWLRKWRPDVVFTSIHNVLDRIVELGLRVPEDVKFINLALRDHPGHAGMDPYTTEVGRAAVDLLVSLMQTHQGGVPEFPRTISIRGKWVSGATFPEPALSADAVSGRV